MYEYILKIVFSDPINHIYLENGLPHFLRLLEVPNQHHDPGSAAAELKSSGLTDARTGT